MENPTKRDAILPVTVMLAMHTLIALAVFIVPVMAPKIGMNAQQISSFVPFLYICSALLTPLSGPCTGRFGPMRMMQFCVVAAAIGIALCCTAHPWVMVLGAGFIGLALGLATPAASDILLRYTPVSIRSLIFSIKQAAVPLGNLIAGLLVWVAVAIGWQYALLAVSVVGVAMAVGFQPLQKTWDEGREVGAHVAFTRQSFLTGLRALLSSQALRWLSLSSFAFVLLQIATASYLVTYLVEFVGIPHVTAGTVYAVAFAGGFFARILFGIVADNYISPMRTLGILGLVMGAASIGVAQFDNSWPIWAITLMTFLLAATAAGWNGVYIAELATQAPPGQTSNVMGIALVMTFGGCIMAPIFFVSVLALSGGSFRVTYMLSAIPAILAGIRLLLLKNQQE